MSATYYQHRSHDELRHALWYSSPRWQPARISVALSRRRGKPAGGPFDTLHFRPIGPASMSGRIADLAVYEANPAIFYVGTAHGGVWKTVNNGTTFEAAVPGQGV